MFKFIHGDNCYCNACKITFIVARKRFQLQHIKMEKHQKNDQLKGKIKATQTYLDAVKKKSKQSTFLKGKFEKEICDSFLAAHIQ